MPRAATIPAETDLLCETCGYTLTGIDPLGRCPECGQPVAESLPDQRHAPKWEDSGKETKFFGFLRTSFSVLFLPRRFFRRLSLPGSDKKSHAFGLIYRSIAGILLGLTAWIHASRFGFLAGMVEIPAGSWTVLAGLMAGVMVLVVIGNRIFVAVTAFEARYRGLRLPRQIVARGLDYHAVHLVPPAVLGLALVSAYAYIDETHNPLAAELTMPYLYTLGGAVIFSAGYLFWTYWAAMKSLMYGNAERRR